MQACMLHGMAWHGMVDRPTMDHPGTNELSTDILIIQRKESVFSWLNNTQLNTPLQNTFCKVKFVGELAKFKTNG
jgi:hypothetical protein